MKSTSLLLVSSVVLTAACGKAELPLATTSSSTDTTTTGGTSGQATGTTTTTYTGQGGCGACTTGIETGTTAILTGSTTGTAVSTTDVLTATMSASTFTETVTGSGTTTNADAGALTPAAVVLFGGITQINGVIQSDTWEFDGTNWANVTPAVGPLARTNASMASLGDKVVMFGGNDGVGLLGDTWEWDGSQWTEVNVANAPSPRSGALMAAYQGNVVLFGGNTATSALTDTWQFDGTTWTALGTYAPPPTPARWGMASVPVGPGQCGAATCPSEILVLFGAGTSENETWAWDGTQWTQIDVAASTSSAYPPPGEGVVANVGNAVLVLQTAVADDTSTGWLWSAGAWVPAYGNGTPVLVQYYNTGSLTQSPCATMAPFGTSAVLFICSTQQTWIWSPPGWAEALPAQNPGGPSMSGGMAMATRYAP